MSDYIKREDIAKYAGGLFRNETDEKPIGYLMSEYQINSIPSEDVAPVRHGRWFQDAIFYGEDGSPCIVDICTECGAYGDYADFNYCPNCGARMDGESDE